MPLRLLDGDLMLKVERITGLLPTPGVQVGDSTVISGLNRVKPNLDSNPKELLLKLMSMVLPQVSSAMFDLFL